jgi:hypothetical protein
MTTFPAFSVHEVGWRRKRIYRVDHEGSALGMKNKTMFHFVDIFYPPCDDDSVSCRNPEIPTEVKVGKS